MAPRHRPSSQDRDPGKGPRPRPSDGSCRAPSSTSRRGLSEADRTLLAQHIKPLVDPSDHPRMLARMEQYFELLLAWNRRGNLISRGDEPRVITRHALDSLAVIPVLDELGPGSILDLGSGGGLPGIPIKILRPSIAVTLLDSRRMKTLFLLRAVRELMLSGVRVWRGRAEDLGALPVGGKLQGIRSATASVAELEGPVRRPCFDAVVARAVAPLSEIAGWAEPLVSSGGFLLAYKGSRLDAEIADWRESAGGWRLDRILREIRPQTHLVVLCRS